MSESFFDTDNDTTRTDIDRVLALLNSNRFLKGLGVDADSVTYTWSSHAVRDIPRADELFLPKELYDLPEPWPYQEFFGEIEHEAGRIQFLTGIPEERVDWLFLTMNKNRDAFDDYLLGRIHEVFASERVREHLETAGNGSSLGKEEFEDFVENMLPHNVHSHILYILKAAYYGGIDASPLFSRMLEAYETGGFPCGWIGPSLEENGDPMDAVVLFHLGQANAT